jgi:hypothetical protein
MESLTTKNQQVADDNMLRTMAKTFGDEDANGIPDWYEKNNLQIETAIQEYKDQLN